MYNVKVFCTAGPITLSVDASGNLFTYVQLQRLYVPSFEAGQYIAPHFIYINIKYLFTMSIYRSGQESTAECAERAVCYCVTK